MDGQPDVLQHRIEVPALDGRRQQTQERVGGSDDESQKGEADPALDGEDQRLQPVGQIAAEGRHKGAEEREDEDPEEHGALVVPPDAGDLVEQRQLRVRVLGDVEHREIGDDMRLYECGEGQGDQQEQRQRSRRRHGHQVAVVLQRAVERDGRLDQRQKQRQHQCEMAKLGNHFACAALAATLSLVSPQRPCAFSASTTSLGM